MRHVSRTHRVSIDWLFDRINYPKIQIRYIDTKHQIADILTKGHFTRDEWNNLLCLFNISHFSSLCCAKNVSLFSYTERTAKRMQEQSEEPDQFCCYKFFICEQSDCGYSKLQVDRLDYQGGLMQAKSKLQSRRSVEFSRLAERCSTVHQHRETCGNKISTSQKIPKIQNPNVELGHIISENHQTVYLTWRRSSRS